MIWEIELEDKLINDLEEEDEEIRTELRAEFNAQRDEAIQVVNAARMRLREQRGIA